MLNPGPLSESSVTEGCRSSEFLLSVPLHAPERCTIFRDMLPAYRKPTGAQIRKKFPDFYTEKCFDYGMQYYVAARFAVSAGFIPVGATLAHHALEAMLKGCAAEGATKEQILKFGYKQNFGHDLLKLWKAFIAKHPKLRLHGFKTMIRQLNDFEKIRFAEQLIGRGTLIEVAFTTPSKQHGPRPRTARRFMLRMDLFDKLVRTIFKAANKNPAFYAHHYQGLESARYYKLRNRFQF